MPDLVTSSAFLVPAGLFAGAWTMVGAAREVRDGEYEWEDDKRQLEEMAEEGGEPGEMMGGQLFFLARQAGAEAYRDDGWQGVGQAAAIGFLLYTVVYGGFCLVLALLL